MIDFSIAALYFIVILIAGIISGQNIKDQKDFAVSQKPFIKRALAITIHGVDAMKWRMLFSGLLGLLTYVFWNYVFYHHTAIHSLVPAAIAHATAFVTLGIIGKNRRQPLVNSVQQKSTVKQNSSSRPYHQRMIQCIHNLFSNFVEQSANRVDVFGAPYGLFVVFSVTNLCFVPLLFAHSADHSVPVFTLYLRVFASALSFVLIMRDFWPRNLVRYLPLYWHLTLFVCLPFFTMTMCIFTSCAIEWVIDLVLTNFILGILVDWKTYSATILAGCFFAVVAFLLFGEVAEFDPNLGNFPIMAYATVISLFVGAIFSRNKERVILEKLATFKALGETIAHEMRTPLSAIQISANGVKEYLPALVEGYERARLAGITVPKIPRLAMESVANAPERMRYICASALNIIDMVLLQLRDKDWSEHFVECSINNCVQTALSEYCFRQDEREMVDDFGLSEFRFFGNQYLVVHILFNLMRNAFAFIHSEKKGRISIWTSVSADKHHLHFCDTAKGISKEDLPFIFDHGFSKRSWGSGVGLHYCKKMMETMSGSIIVRSLEGKYTEFVLSFPKLKAAPQATNQNDQKLVSPPISSLFRVP